MQKYKETYIFQIKKLTWVSTAIASKAIDTVAHITKAIAKRLTLAVVQTWGRGTGC